MTAKFRPLRLLHWGSHGKGSRRIASQSNAAMLAVPALARIYVMTERSGPRSSRGPPVRTVRVAPSA